MINVKLRSLLTTSFVFMLVAIQPIATKAQSNAEWIDEKTGPFEYAPGTAPEHHFNGLTIAKRWFFYYRSFVDYSSGNGWHRLIVTNGDKWTGHTVCSETTYYGENTQLTVSYTLGVNPKSERNELRDIAMPPEFWKSVKTYRIRAGWCPSGRIGDKVIEGVEGFIKIVGSVFIKDEPTEEQNQTTPPTNDTELKHYVWASVYCDRNGYTGHVRIPAESSESCQAAKDQLLSDAQNDKSCPLLFGAGTKFTGEIKYSECGSAWVQKQ